MAPRDDREQIARIPIDTGAAERDGSDLGALLAELQADILGETPADAPAHGWRVLASQNGAASLIGSPADPGAEWWWVGQLVRAPGASVSASVNLHPSPQLRRPSSRERARGLVLRWPAATRSAPDFDLLAIDVVNGGTEPWNPRGDSFVVVGALRRPGESAGSVAFAFIGGQYPALPLDPGEYARVRVLIEPGQWAGLQPGRYEVHPTLVDLGLHGTEALPVDVTQHDIETRTPARPKSVPPTLGHGTVRSPDRPSRD
jgi:hypothetical protein